MDVFSFRFRIKFEKTVQTVLKHAALSVLQYSDDEFATVNVSVWAHYYQLNSTVYSDSLVLTKCPFPVPESYSGDPTAFSCQVFQAPAARALVSQACLGPGDLEGHQLGVLSHAPLLAFVCWHLSLILGSIPST